MVNGRRFSPRPTPIAGTSAAALEGVDLKVGPNNEALLEEHLIACAALGTMKKSVLGRIL